MAISEAQQAWEEHYGERDRVWSGRVNVRLAELVEPMTPGRALDLGCGEGADAMWLAAVRSNFSGEVVIGHDLMEV